MIPDATFRKKDYSVVCKSTAIVRVAVDSGNLNGKVYLRLASNICGFQGNEEQLVKPFTKEMKEVKFTFTISCKEPDDYYTRLITWAVNDDGRSVDDTATVSIDCD